MAIKLTAKRVQDAVCEAGKAETVFWDSEVKGLGLRVRASGAKSWRAVFRLNDGKQVKITLGDADVIPLDDARKLARAEIVKAAGGVDPREDRKAASLADARRVSAVIEAYDRDLSARKVDERHRTNTIRVLKRGLAKALNRDVAMLTRQECVGWISEVVKPGARQSFRQRLTPLLNFAVSQGLATSNVMAGWKQPRRSKAEALAKTGRALDTAEIRAIWNAAEGTFGDAVKVLLLTGLRKTEALSLERVWVDEERGAIIVPASRMKNGRPHAVPLTPALRAILNARPEWANSPLYFPTRSRKRTATTLSGIGQMKDKLQAASGTKDWTVHDTRRTYRSMLSDLGFDEDLCERMIAHARGALIERYDRSSRWPERVAAAEAIERHILKIVSDQTSDKVVPLRPAGAAA